MNVVVLRPQAPEPSPEGMVGSPSQPVPLGEQSAVDAAMRFVFCSQGERGVSLVPEYGYGGEVEGMKEVERHLHPSHEQSFMEANLFLKEYFANARRNVEAASPQAKHQVRSPY